MEMKNTVFPLPVTASIGVYLRLTLLLFLFVWPVSAQAPNSEWRYYGGDEGGSRFSPLAKSIPQMSNLLNAPGPITPVNWI